MDRRFCDIRAERATDMVVGLEMDPAVDTAEPSPVEVVSPHHGPTLDRLR